MSNDEAPERRIRPWIAALLTILGWGVGLYYARNPGAVRAAVLQVLVGVLIGVGVLALMLFGFTDLAKHFSPDRLSWLDAVNWALIAIVGALVWRVAARQQSVPRAGPARLLGYLAIWLAPILVSLVLAFGLRALAWQPFRQPSASMAPTLQAGQYFLVEKWRYGYSAFSFAPFESLLPEGRWMARLPQAGDVVVFRPSHEPSRDYVKRIVAGPGDRVQMRDGVLHLNGAPVTRVDQGDVTLAHEDYSEQVRRFQETLPNGATFATFERGPTELDNTREVTVPAGHYYVMGDNRDFSDDSRRSIGFVPFENIIGPVVARD